MNHISQYLFLSREDDDDVRDIGKRDFRSVLLHPMLSNANLAELKRSTCGLANLSGRLVLTNGKRPYIVSTNVGSV